MTQPQIKITKLSIQGLGPIRSLELPEQGLGWDGNFPDIALLGGVNGSGKTTLLEFIFNAFRCWAASSLVRASNPREAPASSARATFFVPFLSFELSTRKHRGVRSYTERRFFGLQAVCDQPTHYVHYEVGWASVPAAEVGDKNHRQNKKAE